MSNWNWNRYNEQFRETPAERNERLREARRKRELETLRTLIADLSAGLTDEGDDLSAECLQAMRQRVANALPLDRCPDWLKSYRDPSTEARQKPPEKPTCELAPLSAASLTGRLTYPAIEELVRAAIPLIEAARGLSFGEDWNNGNAAKTHGYRQKLIDAVPAAQAALTAFHQSSQAQGEVK